MAKLDKVDTARAHLECALLILDGEGRAAPAYLVELALEHLKPGETEQGTGDHVRRGRIDLASAD